MKSIKIGVFWREGANIGVLWRPGGLEVYGHYAQMGYLAIWLFGAIREAFGRVPKLQATLLGG